MNTNEEFYPEQNPKREKQPEKINTGMPSKTPEEKQNGSCGCN